MSLVKKFFLIISSFLLFVIGQSCSQPKPHPQHIDDPDDPRYCDQVVAISLSIPVDLAEQLFNTNLSISIFLPEWMDFDNIGRATNIAFAGIDKYGKPISEMLDLNLEISSNFSQKTINVNISPFEKEIIENYFGKLKKGSTMDISLNFNLGFIILNSKESYVYDEFDILIRTYSNGILIDETALKEKISFFLTGYLMATLKEVPDNAYSGNSDNLRKALLNKINAVENMIDAKNPQGAYEKLKNDIMAKFDGQNGGNPSDDWIVDPFYSSNLFNNYNKILNVLDYLRN